MNDIFCPEIKSRRDESSAFRNKSNLLLPVSAKLLKPGSLIDGAVTAGANRRIFVRRIYNSVRFHLRDVISDNLKRHQVLLSVVSRPPGQNIDPPLPVSSRTHVLSDPDFRLFQLRDLSPETGEGLFCKICEVPSAPHALKSAVFERRVENSFRPERRRDLF